jgi:histidyl-tRNA synthetase
MIDDYLSAEAKRFFGAVTAGLDAAGVAWERNPALVRGLDYYRHTAFEFVTDRLGAQGTVLAGGRYDGLVESIGGAQTPAVGWAAGIERLAMLVEGVGEGVPEAIVVVEDDDLLNSGIAAVGALRRAGVSAELMASGSPRKRFDKAVKTGAASIVALAVRDGSPARRIKASEDDEARIAAILDRAQ